MASAAARDSAGSGSGRAGSGAGEAAEAVQTSGAWAQTNVANLCIKSHKGSKKPGDLVFDANFESGNLGKVELLSEVEYDLHIRPDTRNPKQRIWFFFKVRNCFAGQRVIFNVVNFSKTKSLYREGMAPMVKTTSRPAWQRVPKQNVFYYKCPRHRKGYIMSFVFVFDAAETYEFAYCYPYTYSRLQSFLGELDAQEYRYLKRERFCETLDARQLDLLTITHPDNMDKSKLTKPIELVFITARVHPGETPASFICHGLIQFLLSDDPDAEMLRQKTVFKIVPMLNPDGVYHGNYRCTTSGYDLNRCWQTPHPINQPEVVAVKKMLAQYTQDAAYNLHFYLDLHAHSTNKNAFLYGNYHNDEARMDAQWVFPHLLALHADDFSTENTDFNSHKAKAGTGRRSLSLVLNPLAQIYTLEVSFYCYVSRNGEGVMKPYDEEGYTGIGYSLGRAFADYYM